MSSSGSGTIKLPNKNQQNTSHEQRRIQEVKTIQQRVPTVYNY